MAPAGWHDGHVRAIRPATRRFLPTGPDLHRRLWRPREATAESDVVEARYVEIVPDVRVVQAVDFVSDDSAFAGTTTMTWEVTDVEDGTRVDITADVPDGISAEEHADGLASSLANLADYLER